MQQPPPIWVGGSSEPALRRVAERGDGWLPQGTLPDQLPQAIATIRSHAVAAGRDPDGLELGAMALPVYVGDPGWNVGRWTTTGPGEQHAEGLRRLRDAGASHVQVRLRSRSRDELLDQLARFADEVMPLLKV